MTKYTIIGVLVLTGCYRAHERAVAPDEGLSDAGEWPIDTELDAGTEFDIEPWLGTYVGPVQITEACANRSEQWNMTTTLRAHGPLLLIDGLCDHLQLQLTGPAQGTIGPATCNAPGRRAWGAARLEGATLHIEGETETSCGTALWSYRGERR